MEEVGPCRGREGKLSTGRSTIFGRVARTLHPEVLQSVDRNKTLGSAKSRAPSEGAAGRSTGDTAPIFRVDIGADSVHSVVVGLRTLSVYAEVAGCSHRC